MPYLKSHLSTILKILAVALPVVVLLILLYQRLVLGFTEWANWTGLGTVTGQVGVARPAKTLWDVVQLLVIPVVLSLGVLYFNTQERKTERRLSIDRTEDAVLQNYLDRVSDLILNRGLMEEEYSAASPVHQVAQVRTVTALRQLSTQRQNSIFQFLRDTGLCETMLTGASLLDIDLCGAHLWNLTFDRSSLIRARLAGASLYAASLKEAKLIDADLSGCRLTGADLSSSLLLRANFSHADLTGAILASANLTGAKWDGANLSGVDLTNAFTLSASGENLPATAETLRGAIFSESSLLVD
ncbi:MAG: pentapeptide repeat-containing protein [Anaerolineaceae bacterium]